MTRFSFIAISLLSVVAQPALADAGVQNKNRTGLQTAIDGSTVCLRRLASDRCSTYQSAILRTVAHKVGQSDTSLSMTGRRQLDALIASIN